MQNIKKLASSPINLINVKFATEFLINDYQI
jgi:hypothetical protein